MVAAALKDVLHLEEDLQEHEVTSKGTAGGFFSLLSLKPGDEEWFLPSDQMRNEDLCQQLLLQGAVWSQGELSWRAQQSG